MPEEPVAFFSLLPLETDAGRAKVGDWGDGAVHELQAAAEADTSHFISTDKGRSGQKRATLRMKKSNCIVFMMSLTGKHSLKPSHRSCISEPFHIEKERRQIGCGLLEQRIEPTFRVGSILYRFRILSCHFTTML
jgi:hypothetical protein